MKKLEIITRPDNLEKLKVLLNNKAVGGLSVTSIMGCGIQKGDVTGEVAALKVSGMNLIPKIHALVVVNDESVDEILNLIHEKLSTNKVGDGKVFVTHVDDAMRIRTGERNTRAISF